MNDKKIGWIKFLKRMIEKVFDWLNTTINFCIGLENFLTMFAVWIYLYILQFTLSNFKIHKVYC